jgi:hypothetical protein
MGVQITPEQESKISEAKKHLPEGFEVVKSTDIDALLIERDRLKSVFTKLKPLFAPFAGTGEKPELMQAIPMMMPAIAQLQNDPDLIENMNVIIDSLK